MTTLISVLLIVIIVMLIVISYVLNSVRRVLKTREIEVHVTAELCTSQLEEFLTHMCMDLPPAKRLDVPSSSELDVEDDPEPEIPDFIHSLEINPDNPPKASLYKGGPKTYNCTCHGRPLLPGSMVTLWPLPKGQVGMHVLCAETMREIDFPDGEQWQ